MLYWIGWLLSSITLASGHTFLVSYTVLCITLSLTLFIGIRALRKLQYTYRHLVSTVELHALSSQAASSLPSLYHRLQHATSWESYLQTALLIDQLTGAEQWKLQHASRAYDYLMLEVQVASLIHARTRGDHRALAFALQSVLYRHFCSIDSEQLYLQSEVGTKHLVEEFYARVVEQLSYIATLPDDSSGLSARAKLRFFQRARKSYGRTALCLSGGGALAMYHIGVVKALIAGNCLPSIVAGTSGGSIVAGFLAISTDAELADPALLSNDISSKYGCRWLPPLGTQLNNFLRERVLMDSREFTHTCQQYYTKQMTFEEAFRRTGRDVSITVSYASKQGSTLRSHALTLNHITSPTVLIWSAVVTSCALPGLMHPQTLYAKSYAGTKHSILLIAHRTAMHPLHSTWSSPCNVPLLNEASGEIVPYSSVAEWVDGTLQQDLPFQRLTELFNAQCFVVSQVNPHVTPFVSQQPKQRNYTPTVSLLSRLEQHLQADISHRLRRLVSMNVIPRVYGQDWSGMIDGQQRYSGDINILPQMRYRMLLKALQHPSREDMDEYIRGGETAAWAQLSQVQNSLIIERTLEQCVKAVSASLRTGEHGRTGAAVAKLVSVGGPGEAGFPLRRDEESLHALINSDGSVNPHPSPSPAPPYVPPAAQPSPMSAAASEAGNDWGERDLEDEMSLTMTPITSPAAREVSRVRRAVSYGAQVNGQIEEEERANAYTPRRHVKF